MSKPPFDPSKPFQSAKPAFDPSQPFETDAIQQEPPQPQPSTIDYVSSFARPALETAGMFGGALLGAGAGIPTGPGAIATGVAGAGLGYAAGRQAANILDESLGVRQTPPLTQQFKDTASDVQSGAMGQMVGLAAGPVLNSVGRALKPSFPTSLTSAVFGPSTEAIEARLADPSRIANAPSYANQAESLTGTLGIVKKKITDAFNAAGSTLRSSIKQEEGAIAKSKIQSILDSLKSNIEIKGSVVGQAEKGASSSLGSLSNDIENILKPIESPVKLLGPNGQPLQIAKPETYIPESDIKRVIQAIDKNINWEDKAASATNASLTDARGQLDKLLKTQNPTYAKAMKPVSQYERLYNDARDAFSIKNRTGEGLTATDSTISKIQSLPQDRKAVTQKVSRRLQAATGRDMIGESKTYGLAKQFVGGATQGSRRVNLGGIVGSGVGAAIGGWSGAAAGSAAGGLAGAYLDKAGGQIAGSLIDKYVASGVSRIAAPQAGASTRAIISAYVARRQSE